MTCSTALLAEHPGLEVGSVHQWRDQLVAAILDHGMNGLVYWPADDHARQLARFAEEVRPAVCEALGSVT